MKSAIILMNLGSPDSTSVKDVKKYLNQFLMDKRVIDSPLLVRLLVVKGIIVPFRAAKSAEAYRSVWTPEGSPLIVISKQLRDAVQQNTPVPVRIAMRYGSPSSENVLKELHNSYPQLEKVLLVPLYPHYAMSSYETAVTDMLAVHRKGKFKTRVEVVKPYYDDRQYIGALAESMRPFLTDPFDKILFSYHGVPERHIRKGDCTGEHCLKVKDCCHVASPAHAACYRHQTFKTTELVAQELNLPPEKVEQSFQSRLGRDPWLQPYTAARLEQLPGEGCKRIVVACPAFVSDCLETLEEIAEEGRETFMHAGGESFKMIPCLNTHPLWVKAITDWIDEFLKDEDRMFLKEDATALSSIR